MWCEVLSLDEARQTPMAKLSRQTIEEAYEVRLIVWETRDVVLADGDSVDIYVKAIYCEDSWAADEIAKQTDIHYASKDGRGVFNWRMKFPLKIPCDYPRIKLQLYNYKATKDECLGEAMLNIKNTVVLLQK